MPSRIVLILLTIPDPLATLATTFLIFLTSHHIDKDFSPQVWVDHFNSYLGPQIAPTPEDKDCENFESDQIYLIGAT